MNKKGIFFTFAAIVLSIVIIYSYDVYTGYRLKEKMEVTEIRISTMNNFIKDLENDIDNAILISGFRSLLSMEDYMMDHRKFFNDGADTPLAAEAFEQAFLYGTIRYVFNNENMPLMDNNTFLNWTERMKVEANKTGIELEFTLGGDGVTIGQTEPWKVDISVKLIIDVKDKKDIASWTIGGTTGKTYTRQINITSEIGGQTKFVDPLYLKYTNGIANNTIRKTTVADFSTIGRLQDHVDDSYYIENTDAPSYLNRFDEDKKFTASANGIESLADVETLSGLGLGLPSGKTAVDHLYFDTSSGTSDCKIEGMGALYDWFLLDFTAQNHKDDPYGAFNCV